MALMIDLAHDPLPNPQDYGLKDFYHNKQGQVDYTYFYDSRIKNDVSDVVLQPREQQRYKDVCTDQALENLRIEKERYTNIYALNKEYERWLEDWN